VVAEDNLFSLQRDIDEAVYADGAIGSRPQGWHSIAQHEQISPARVLSCHSVRWTTVPYVDSKVSKMPRIWSVSWRRRTQRRLIACLGHILLAANMYFGWLKVAKLPHSSCFPHPSNSPPSHGTS